MSGVRPARDGCRAVRTARSWRGIVPFTHLAREGRMTVTIGRRELMAALGGAAAAWPLAARAQQPAKVWRIGMLETISSAQNAPQLDAFRQRLQQLGYVEGINFVIEYRSAEGRGDRFPPLVAELIQRNVDLLVLRGTPAAIAVKNATSTIPVVMTAVGDPLLVVASLSRPGGNVTGLSSFVVDLEAKGLEWLK